jgi:uncharacterized protein (DUF169 family)
MDSEFKSYFISRWQNYFPDTDLPIGYFYTDQPLDSDLEGTLVEQRCLIGNLERVRKGHPFVYQKNTPGCSGGKRYSGFNDNLHPKFEYFLSCGIPGELEGERYKKTPELVQEYLKNSPPFEAPNQFLVFKRFDQFSKNKQPLAVIFFANHDVLSGLFTLANYDRADLHGVIAPMGSGCASIISHPYFEAKSASPRCVMGMFDISARPYVPKNSLTFSIPMKRFKEMVLNMDESFLITESWQRVRARLS